LRPFRPRTDRFPAGHNRAQLDSVIKFGDKRPTHTGLESPVDPQAGKPALVRLRAHLNSRVKVPDLADTEGPIAERNCIGAIPPGGEQREANDQSVTPSAQTGRQRELDSVGGSGESARERRSPNNIVLPAQREWTRLAENRRWLEMEWLEVEVT